MYQTKRCLIALCLLCMLVAACSSSTTKATVTPTSTVSTGLSLSPTSSISTTTCPAQVGSVNCQTPQSMRDAYGVSSLITKGDDGKGQTIVDIVSFGSSTLQQDMDTFDQQFGLPAITIQQISPLNEAPYDPRNDRPGWGDETTLDVEIMHSLAPAANIVVLTSPVAETEGTQGLPEFRQLLQYAIDKNLGKIISLSWGASEMTLKDAVGQTEVQKWDALLKQATTQDGMTIFASSGDNGATDYADTSETQFSRTPTTGFPADDPWITAVGGTSLRRQGTSFNETAWDSSGGGLSAFFAQPTYQKTLAASVQTLLQNKRGVPDVSADADPNTGLAMYENGIWSTAGGTSASAPLWSGLAAIANQMAGRPLGFLNTALYTIAGTTHYQQDFHDITVGNNGVTNGSVQLKGYDAVTGWDAITGLGSPNAANLLPDLIAASKS